MGGLDLGPGTEVDKLLEPYGVEEGDNWLQELVEDETNKLLAALVIEMQRMNGNASTVVDSAPDGPAYESHQDVTARPDSERSTSFNLTAGTVVVHNVTDTVQVSTIAPGESNRIIEVQPKDSPLTLSGVNGINAGTLWYQAKGSSETNFGIIAIR